MIEAFNLN